MRQSVKTQSYHQVWLSNTVDLANPVSPMPGARELRNAIRMIPYIAEIAMFAHMQATGRRIK